MRTITGTASNVRHTTHVTNGGSRTEHIALFDIGGERCSFRGETPVMIEEGDALVLVVEPGTEGTMRTLGFDNRTRSLRGYHVPLTGCTGTFGCFAFVFVLMIPFQLIAGDTNSRLVASVVGTLGFLGLLTLSMKADRMARSQLQEVQRLLDGEPTSAG